MLRLSNLFWKAGLSRAIQGASVKCCNRRLSFQDLRDDGMAVGLRASPSCGHQRHADASEPGNFLPVLGFSSRWSGGPDRASGMCGANAARLRQAERPSHGRTQRPSRYSNRRPGGEFFVFPDVSGQLHRRKMQGAREFCAMLLREYGVVVVPGEGFGSASHVRLAYSVSERQLARGLGKIRESAL